VDRTILHCDCNGFYAAVETVLRPELAAVPMAVCGEADKRHGIILAKNEKAKAFGVKTAETIWQAKRKCPGLVLVPPHHAQYRRMSEKVNAIYGRFTDLVEPFGIDESWLDVTGTTHLFGDGKTIADTLRDTVRHELGITISAGVSFNKVFAKLGSDYKKPDATTVITKENFRAVLWPLPASDLLFVGRAAEKVLSGMGIHTIGELAAADKALLHGALGKLGDTLHRYANGLDDAPVRPEGARELKSVGNGMTFSRDLVGIAALRAALLPLADEVAARMRKHGVKCRAVQLQIRDPSFKTISRQRQLEVPSDLSSELAAAALSLLRQGWPDGKPVRMLTLTALSLLPAEEAGEQLTLFDDGAAAAREKRERLERALDRIRARYGPGAITGGGTLHSPDD